MEPIQRQVTDLEVEVLEIDGVVPSAAKAGPEQEPSPSREWQDWRHWQGRVRRLDSRWWPLWMVLGIIVLGFLLTVGLLLGVIFLVFRMLLKIFRALGAGFGSGHRP